MAKRGGTSSSAAAWTARRSRCRWAGGAEGERERPLLRCDADWDALGDGLYAFCHDCGEAEAIQLLGMLDDAGAFDEVLALARLVLERLKWGGHAVSVDAIAAWVPLAVKLDPRPEPPAVAMTWLELEPSELPADAGRAGALLRLGAAGVDPAHARSGAAARARVPRPLRRVAVPLR